MPPLCHVVVADAVDDLTRVSARFTERVVSVVEIVDVDVATLEMARTVR